MIKKNIYKEPYIEEPKCHGGQGFVFFRRVLAPEFDSDISFLDYTVIPPGSTIGYHKHSDSEEVYIILKGEGSMCVDSVEELVIAGDVILNKNGSSHGLVNTGNENLEILVFEGACRS